ncbi:MAG: hypothetical protein HKN37_02835 [Rhodothermales bacterium]|nr:hypothetical protein [Rhodothermales bacterium]
MGILTGVIALSAWAGNAPVDEAVRAPGEKDVFHVTSIDSLSYAVKAGALLITHLPDSVGGQPVDVYESLLIPARSWRSGPAFFWQTKIGDDGTHTLLFRAISRGLTVDTLTVTVDVIP